MTKKDKNGKSKKAVLVVSNPLNHEGGVVNYYRSLLKHFECDHLQLLHHASGSRMSLFYFKKTKAIVYPLFYMYDILAFFWKLVFQRQIHAVQVSPSLIPVPLLRDSLYILIGLIFRKKIIVFYRGWKYSFFKYLLASKFTRFAFIRIYGQADMSIVLADQFRRDLIKLGLDKTHNIKISTTIADVEMPQLRIKRQVGTAKLLYLGRVSERKGVHELLAALKMLSDRGVDFHCSVVGHGESASSLDDCKVAAEQLGIEEKVDILGPLYAADKEAAYLSHDLFILPSHSEGCPNSVLEALTFGLFVIATNVGAMPDLLEDDSGTLCPAKSPVELAVKLEQAIGDIERIRAGRQRRSEVAWHKFSPPAIVRDMRSAYQSIIGKDPHGS